MRQIFKPLAITLIIVGIIILIVMAVSWFGIPGWENKDGAIWKLIAAALGGVVPIIGGLLVILKNYLDIRKLLHEAKILPAPAQSAIAINKVDTAGGPAQTSSGDEAPNVVGDYHKGDVHNYYPLHPSPPQGSRHPTSRGSHLHRAAGNGRLRTALRSRQTCALVG